MQHTDFLHNLKVADLIHFWEKLYLSLKNQNFISMRKFTKKKLEPSSKSNLKKTQYFYEINLEHKIKKLKNFGKP